MLPYSRLLVATLAVWHLVAISVASLPAPQTQDTRDAAVVEGQMAANHLARFLNAGNEMIERGSRALGPLRRVTRPYVRAIGLEQRWNMFAEPPDSDQYAQMRYYIRSSTGSATLWVDRELIFPATREDVYRPFSASYYEEKALRNTRQRFLRNLRERDAVTRVADLPQDLVPVIRYYAARYRTRNLTENEAIGRAELWLGAAPVAAPGQQESGAMDARLAALRAYHLAPRSQLHTASAGLPVGTREREADISWTLAYFEAR